MTTITGAPRSTAALQMMRADVNMQEFQRWMGTRRLQDPDHAMHCLLRETFGDLAPRPFRLVVPRGGARGVLYGYGHADADGLHEAANTFAEPLQTRAIPPTGIDSKPMPSEWKPGKRLGFDLRVRPVIRKSRNADRPGVELDAYQVLAETYPKEGMPHSREQVYAGWLSDQLHRHDGAELESGQAKLVSFQRTRAFRKARSRYVEGPDAVLRGVLVITNPEAFANLLSRGVGRHRAYGFGMLLLRPPGRILGS